MADSAKPRGTNLIQSYGLFWDPDQIDWGAQGYNKAGKLAGREKGRASAPEVDFREQAGIYVLYSNYNIVYVGQAGSGNRKLFDRIKDHYFKDNRGRWDRFSWFGIRKVVHGKKLSKLIDVKTTSPRYILNQFEGVLIYAAEPPLNRQGGKMGTATEYIQVPLSEKTSGEQEVTLDQIHKELIELKSKVRS